MLPPVPAAGPTEFHEFKDAAMDTGSPADSGGNGRLLVVAVSTCVRQPSVVLQYQIFLQAAKTCEMALVGDKFFIGSLFHQPP